jgi:hypothetical protein
LIRVLIGLDPAFDPLDPTLDPLDLERQDRMSVKPLVVRALLRSTSDPPSITFGPPSLNLRHRSCTNPPSVPFDHRRPILFGALSFPTLHHNRPLSVPTSTRWLRHEHRAPSLSRILDWLFRFVMVVVPHGSPAIFDAFCPAHQVDSARRAGNRRRWSQIQCSLVQVRQATCMYRAGVDALAIQFNWRWASDTYKLYTRLGQESVASVASVAAGMVQGGSERGSNRYPICSAVDTLPLNMIIPPIHISISIIRIGVNVVHFGYGPRHEIPCLRSKVPSGSPKYIGP